jgi:peptidoglycan hydrolase-like protein with peptidoglycan-binding domain
MLLCVLFWSVSQAEQLTVESLIGLKDLGFSEAEIKEQVTRTGEPVSMNDADVETLKQAGFSEELIRFLKNPPPVTEAATQPRTGSGEEQLPPPGQEQPTKEPEDRPQETVPPPKKQPVFSEQVLQIQQHLNRLGYDAGTEDGIMGGRTRAAIRRFQADIGVRVDGKASAQLLTQLTQQSGERGSQGLPQRLVGGWQAVYQGSFGNQTEMYLDLFPDGTFSSSSSSAMGYAEGGGSYRVQGNVLILQTQYGQIEQYRFRFRGQQLIVNMPQVGEDVVFSRYSWEMQ